MRVRKRFITKLFFLFFIACKVFSASPVDFYATVSSSQDTGMIKMTTDLFYNQFLTLSGYTVNDKRDIKFSPEEHKSSNIAFYAEIQEDEDGSWICTLNALKTNENKNVSSTKKYASYYKILMDAKASLENLLLNLSGDIDIKESTARIPQEDSDIMERLSGTWQGEDCIEKIVILRGGKGFVIHKNGATMNVTVEIKGDTIRISQIGRSNASYYPELSRTAALKAAMTAPPVTWTLKEKKSGTLSGTKQTLKEDSSSETGVAPATLNVEWVKK